MHSKRVPVEEAWNPEVGVAFVFSEAKPEYMIATPMFNVESYAAKSILSTLTATTGLWSLDIILDTCVDRTQLVAFNSILNYFMNYDYSKETENMCSKVCKRATETEVLEKKKIFDATSMRLKIISHPCTTISLPTRIRIITSKTTLLEARAENLAFTSASSVSYYISVQADMLVHERGWNFYAAVPDLLWPDVFSSGK